MSPPTIPGSPPSSAEFAATILPDRTARAWVAGTGVVAYAAGLWLIAGFDIGTPWRIVVAAFWCGDAAISLHRFRRAASRLAAVRIRVHGLELRYKDGRRTEARLLTGATVLRRVAWLRMEGVDGVRYQELVLRSRTGPAEWHRLQLIWQLCGRDFGHTGTA